MPANKYKGKRVAVTFPQSTFEELAKLSKQKTRSVSATVVLLVEEGLKNLKENLDKNP